MRQRTEMTSFEQAVIARLRREGYNALAALAWDAWAYGERLPIREPSESARSNLITDFARANAQAADAQ